ncbi:[protein-PII] uridylyltransferase [Trichlorobacter ammonificans]|nr:[protein-PII] uridylyltransferase [Trichlorobacter ammonificans]
MDFSSVSPAHSFPPRDGRSFDERRPLLLAACKQFITDSRQAVHSRHDAGASGTDVVHWLARMMDTLVTDLFADIVTADNTAAALAGHLTLVAVGGYGRGELNPFSDVDIMFLHDGTVPQETVEAFAQKLLYFLWDLRLDVGYSVRTAADCVELAAADATIKTALIDCRFLAGHPPLFDTLHKTVFRQILPKSSDSFIKEKIAEMRRRRGKYGATIYLLEPNLKEGEGGLRDLQTALWVARVKYKFDTINELVIKGVLSEEELEVYHNALDHLWRMRNEMHFHTGRKSDQLNFDLQVHMARYFGYTDRGRVLAVEDFMRDFYRHAARVEHFASTLVSRCIWRDEGALKVLGYFVRRPVGEGCFVLKGELIVPDESVVEKNPAVLMHIFELAQKHRVTLNIRVKWLVRRSLHLVNDKFRRNRAVNQAFLNILRSDKGVADTLRLMHHLEFLNEYIPEFEHIYCKVQHDLYHIYTVDIHTLFAVEQIEGILNDTLSRELPLPCRVARQIGKRELLILSVMFHDIGKGEGGGHAEKGAAMIPTIARRMGLSKEDSERLEFLVRNHLLFAHIAQRRDLSDEKMILQFARQMGTSENLKMLYLLTVADVRAVGSDVWTTWKASLLNELYEKAFNILERGDFKLEAGSERARTIRRTVREMVEYDIPAVTAREELRALPVRYLLSTPLADIADHLRLLVRLESSDLVLQVRHEPEHGYSTITICTFDVYGLFAMITGVMAAGGMNILGAQINTSKKGKVLDILQVNSPQGFLITDENRWQKAEDDLRKVLHGTLSVVEMVENRHRPTLLTSKPAPRVPTRVEIDNEVSEEYTVIDIYAHDKVGLLYLITSTLNRLGLYIGVSKISTKVDQVADVFYVKDIFGHKIIAEDKLNDIKSTLAAAIDDWT